MSRPLLLLPFFVSLWLLGTLAGCGGPREVPEVARTHLKEIFTTLPDDVIILGYDEQTAGHRQWVLQSLAPLPVPEGLKPRRISPSTVVRAAAELGISRKTLGESLPEQATYYEWKLDKNRSLRLQSLSTAQGEFSHLQVFPIPH